MSDSLYDELDEADLELRAAENAWRKARPYEIHKALRRLQAAKKRLLYVSEQIAIDATFGFVSRRER